MRHGVKKVKLGSDKDHGKSIVRGLAVTLILNDKVKTTEVRAKAVVPFVEKAIQYGIKKDKLMAIRHLEKLLQHPNASKKILEVLVEKYKGKSSGFVRRTFLSFRKGDAAHLVLIELV